MRYKSYLNFYMMLKNCNFKGFSIAIKSVIMNLKKDLLIYVVEDNKIYNHVVCQYLSTNHYTNVRSFLTGKDCIDRVSEGEHPAVVIQDYFLDDYTGIEIMQSVKKYSKNTEFVFLTVNDNLKEAVNTVKKGAFEYHLKEDQKTLEQVVNNIEEISLLVQKRKKIRLTKNAMIILLVIIMGIVAFAFLNTFFNV